MSQPSPFSYDASMQKFHQSLRRSLSGAVLPRSALLPDAKLTLALNDIAYAVRQRRQTHDLVPRACAAFADFAAKHEAEPRSDAAQQLRSAQ